MTLAALFLAGVPALAVEEPAGAGAGTPAVAPAIHEEPGVPEEPFPVDGWPWDVRATAFLLPVQDAAWLTDDAPFHMCPVDVSWTVAGPSEVQVSPECHPPMAAPCELATRSWHFEAQDAMTATGSTRFTIRYVYRYSAQVGTTTLHAEVDPGEAAALDGQVGPPGVKLVHPARASREVTPRLPRAARNAGLYAGACPVDLTVDPEGRPREVRARPECPEQLAEAGVKAAGKWRFVPRVVDAVTEPEAVTVVVAFR
jgi:hypothetical protein